MLNLNGRAFLGTRIQDTEVKTSERFTKEAWRLFLALDVPAEIGVDIVCEITEMSPEDFLLQLKNLSYTKIRRCVGGIERTRSFEFNTPVIERVTFIEEIKNGTYGNYDDV